MAVPVLTAIVLFFWFNRETLWWEFAIPFGVSILLIVICKYGTEAVQTHDTEYWTGWMTDAEYYEPWDEEVPCCHAVYRTVTDSKGNTHEEFVGYAHPYDVSYHGPHWEVHDSNGFEVGINQGTFEDLCHRFGNRQFVDLHRNYHSIDGDKYVATWPGDDAKLVSVVTTHSYENRVQASKSLFNFQEVDPKVHGLFEYPRISGFYDCPSILGDGGPTQVEAEKILSLANAKLGASKKLRLMVLIYKNQPVQAGFDQENYWKGSNKNEFILTIGVDKDYNVQWCHPISWTEAEGLKVDARNMVVGQQGKPLDLPAIANWLVPESNKRFVHRSFKEFSYLTVEPPMWAIILTFVLTLAVNIGVLFWLVSNEYSEFTPYERYTRS